MSKDIQNKIPKNIFNAPILIRLAMWIGKAFSRKAGRGLAKMIGSIVGSFKNSAMVRAIRANQFVIHQEKLGPDALNQLPKEVFRSSAMCIFDYFHYLTRPEALMDVVHFSPEAESAFERIQQDQPTVIVCPHLSNFDLMGYALALKGIRVQVLSFPNPNTSYKVQNELRESTGMLITPMDLNAFRMARKRLKSGGSILTGLDRPLSAGQLEKYQPKFFGHPANLPVAYVRMALEANAPVYVMAAASQPDNTYSLLCSNPFWMQPANDLEAEILTNAESVLQEAEKMITEHYRQWAMFYPIWPAYLGV